MHGYNPKPPLPTPPEIPLERKSAANDIKALYLSKDGLKAYRDDRGAVEVAHWDTGARRFDSWWSCPEGLPEDMEKL